MEFAFDFLCWRNSVMRRRLESIQESDDDQDCEMECENQFTKDDVVLDEEDDYDDFDAMGDIVDEGYDDNQNRPDW